MIKSFLAGVGVSVLLLALLGSFGIGHFRLFYGPDYIECIVKEQK